ncbi:DUF4166 domain-containing protein [Halorussus halophilus]|uniref:DUF4166 domain-containing protein n=1 Tax=Halorussus halophilus TaxID=2650975 RepID=UPI00178829C3|nr:DUF4166 domain-containing protein [Halorussus halophilus]
MTSLFERAVGDDWSNLHPKLRERYGLVADDDRTAVGRGTMTRLTRGALALPILYLGTTRNLLFPEDGKNVAFEIRSEAFTDARGFEALTLRRRFETDPVRRFDDTMRWNPERDCITDFLGTDGRLVSDLHIAVESGGLALELGDQWLRVGERYVPIPDLFSAEASLRDWYDDYADCFRVGAAVTNPIAGHVFGYQGSFQNSWGEASLDAERVTDPTLREVRLPGARR